MYISVCVCVCDRVPDAQPPPSPVRTLSVPTAPQRHLEEGFKGKKQKAKSKETKNEKTKMKTKTYQQVQKYKCCVVFVVMLCFFT